ncbi:DUF2391 family protein [Halogeometricum borinquense]|uniref:Integral membrane protein (DUF2391) n=2 Tax=Halogeometricum borinquense TaxID=60847 RepID=E4NSS6_HALBP|nr:DUF2391 family protein [Halogeometricum borinquense]ADQ65814.1 Putative integral membrane protein (DUF2391) [Halogeometricum borinquense DSM 11551]ELY26816.1 hypothetical protein C499_11436 [Halogeometricum borinquense DSM 11551]QIB76325.1 DUF2391 family protein [Halogeometricum borinquense]QIQ75239.1 DUF2391 family protein [Halogeometricum borinquense]RYJ14914.1 DUF2391 family protein [Halogeometricum borinquense]
MVGVRRRFALSDTAQQIVGGFLLAGPFVVTEEVWSLAASMSAVQGVFTVVIVLTVGYGALYKADDRDPDRERDLLGVPVRFVSLILVAYLSVLILALAFDAPGTFLSDMTGNGAFTVFGLSLQLDVLEVTLKATSIGAVFSVIGAATADSVF